MKPALALAACLTLAGCAHAADSVNDPVKRAAPGGWSGAPVDDAQVKIAARHAVHAQSANEGVALTLMAIENAQRQVVAGLNYQLRLAVMKGGERRIANALVWGKLNGSYELTAWSWE